MVVGLLVCMKIVNVHKLLVIYSPCFVPVKKPGLLQYSSLDSLNFKLRSNRLRTGRSVFGSWQGQRSFLQVSVSRLALGSTQPPVQWEPGILFQEVKRGRSVKLTTLPHLVERSRMNRSYTISSPKHGLL
jgi:hypothetical protein